MECTHCQINFTPTWAGNKKFCSPQCRKAFHIKKRLKPAGWVRKHAKALNNKKTLRERQQKYVEMLETHHTTKEFEDLYDITYPLFEKYCSEHLNSNIEKTILNVTYVNGVWGGGVTCFIPKNIITQIEIYKSGYRKEKQQADGFVSLHYILDALGVQKLTYWQYCKAWGRRPNFDTSQRGFLKDSADEFILFIKGKLREKAEQREQERLARKAAAVEQVIARKEARRRAREEREARKVLEREQKKAEREAQPKKKPYHLREDDWTSPGVYEAKVRGKLAAGLSGKRKISAGSLKHNAFYHSEQDAGRVVQLPCKTCSASKPYYDFHFASSGRGRDKTCKACNNHRSNNMVAKSKDASQFATQFIVSIKRALARQHGNYVTLSADEIWAALPYTREQFLEHVQSLMEPWMSWENNTRASAGGKSWHLDHVIPKSSFVYASLVDETFRECWALSNLRPIEAFTNITKNNNRDLNRAIAGRLRYALRRGVKRISWGEFFTHSLEQYRTSLEAKFCDGMTWDNMGKVWHIDHIVPCASLPWDTLMDENYKKLWSPSNLQPLLAQENLAKSSKHDNKKHFYGNI